MSVDFLKPYELSIWEDELVEDIFQDEPISYYKENKIAIIASNDLKGPNTAYNIVLKKNKNGEKTLSFSIKYRYFDYQTQTIIENPFASYLINERKIKLKFGEDWYDFIIKECTESSEDYEWSYTAEDAFVLELSKNGYNIELNQELNNNQGSAVELALRTLEDTNWDVMSIDLKPPIINEPLYTGLLAQAITVHDMDDDHLVTLPKDVPVFLFYSYITNQKKDFVQFIINNPNDYQIDDNNNIIATNYRFDEPMVYGQNSSGPFIAYESNPTEPVIEYGAEVYTEYQGYRYIYQQLSTYDPVMERMVKEYDADGTLIYGYTDSTYTTSNVVMSYVSNGNNFNTYENGSLQGWSKYTGNEETHPFIELTTDPVIDVTKPLVDLSKIKQLEGYLKVEFTSDNNSYLCNTGFIDNKAFIDSIARGDKFIFRYRAGMTDIPESEEEVDRGLITKLQGNEINALVAFYTREYSTDLKDYINTINTNGTILSFRGQGEKLNNKITEGYLEDNKYWINGVVQEPSTKYIYVSNDIEYIWNAQEGAYIELTPNNNRFLDYYYLVASAQQAVSTDVLNDINTRIGIFISTIDSNKWYYLQDIQLTRYYEDANGNPLMIGNIPTAIALDTNYYYIAPKIGTAANKVRTYASLDILAENMGVDPTTIKPIYNGGSIPFFETTNKPFYVHQQNFQELMEQFHVRGYSLDKILSIEASKSNCFNILQLIAETFECWVDLQVDHNEDGSLYLDALGKPTKLIYLRGYSGKDNDAGFKYGININSITREINSNEIVTKLIVEPVNSEYTDSGVVTIQNASANVSGESYIFNFDYYFNHDLIANVTACKNDMYQFDTDIRDFNIALDELNKEKINLEASLTQLSARRNVYTTLIDTAQEKLAQSLEDFEAVAGYTYETYQSITEEEQADLLEIDTVADIVGEIYTDSIVINNYSGITTNTDTEYLRLKKQLEGIKEHSIKISRFQNTEDSQWHVKVELDDYIVPFSFTLGGTTYETTLNDKVFDIETTEIILDNFIYNANIEDGYTLKDSNDNIVSQVTATENRPQYIRLVPNTEVDGVLDQIEEKIYQKKARIKDFYNKYSRFILEGTWSSQDYLSDDLYYLDALQVSNTSAHPQVTYTIDVAEISGLEGYEGYQFDTGDITYIEDTEFFGWKIQNGLRTPIKEEVIVSEIEWHLDDPSSNTITIQNYKTKFEDLFQRIQATVQTVQYNEATYVKTNRIVNPDGTLNQQMLLNSLNSISGLPQVLTTDGSIIIDGNAIFIRNLTNASDVVKLSSEGISISGDGGLTWSTAVSGRGISVDNLFAGSINTDKITIGGADSPSFRWDSNGLSAFKKTGATSSDEEGVYDFSKFVRFDQYGIYGIDLANSNGTSEFVPEDLEDVEENAHFALTWHGFFIRNNYEGGGRVEITSDNDFRVLNIPRGKSTLQEKIKIGALEWDTYVPTEDEEVVADKPYYIKTGDIYTPVLDPSGNPSDEGWYELVKTTNPAEGVGAPTLYGIRIQNDAGAEVFKTGDDGNLYIEGAINATGGNFSDLVTVGKNSDDVTDYIVIDGIDSSISSANYNYTAGGSGWIINKDGDAVFNNITARGAIKTAVFEYAEIQAVGGVFLFRPSSTIKTAELNGNDLVLTVEKPKLFTTDEWCKVSNYITNGNDPDIDDIANNGGLSHVYKISVNTNTDPVEITLINGKALTDVLGSNYALKLAGGALVDMGRDNTNEQFYSNGIYNYGIGINSSDNSVNLPARAISLFETTVNDAVGASIRVAYDYQAILGTLPTITKAGNLYDTYLKNTQGIFTDNIYLGNNSQFIAFYTDKEATPQKHLRIESANLRLNDSGAYISGEVVANSGYIGGWHISTDNNKSLYYGNSIPGETTTNLILSPIASSNPTTNAISIAGSGLGKTWFISAGRNFGVDTAGILYAMGARICGALTATSLTIDPTATITDDSGLVTNEAIEIGGTNLIVSYNAVATPDEYEALDVYLSEPIESGQNYILQLWDVDVSYDTKSIDDLGVDVYYCGNAVHLGGWHGNSYFTTSIDEDTGIIVGHADHLQLALTLYTSGPIISSGGNQPSGPSNALSHNTVVNTISMTRTTDTEIDSNKTYYIYDDTIEDYQIVIEPQNEELIYYFEIIHDKFLRLYNSEPFIEGVCHLTVDHYKLEKGTKPTSWSQSPIDSSTEITTVNNDVGMIQNSLISIDDKITQTNEEINSVKGSVNQVYSYVDEGLNEAKNTADSFITHIDANGTFIHKKTSEGEGILISDNIDIIRNSEVRVSIDENGLVIYTPNGDTPIAQYGTSAIIGDENSFRVIITDQQLIFYNKAIPVAWLNGNELYVNESNALQEMTIGERTNGGEWSWQIHKLSSGQNNLGLRWGG